MYLSKLSMVAHTYNPSTLETQASSMSTWVTSQTLPERRGERRGTENSKRSSFKAESIKKKMFLWIKLLVNF